MYCYHYNATGSTIAVTDEAQTVVNQYSYDPHGNILGQREQIPQSFKYVGQYGVMAEPNGFYYMRARYYDPKVGRFVSEDPIGFEGGDVNLYAYVANNPVMGIDPEGTFNACGTAAGAAIGASAGPLGAALGAAIGTVAGTYVGIYIWDKLVEPLYSKPPSDAHDPNGAKAPGKPGKTEGFLDPKGGENWTKNPNGSGSGWEAKDGKVWVPTGPKPSRAHGGPHWDVQDPRTGTHINVKPGG
jgi:RHS repeat-associated protein